jgi:SPP1 family holin
MKTRTDTIARTIILALVLINAVLKMLGMTPIELDDNVIYEAVTVISMIVVPIWTWWKNNSFTIEAKKADEILKIMREEGIPAVEQLLDMYKNGFRL